MRLLQRTVDEQGYMLTSFEARRLSENANYNASRCIDCFAQRDVYPVFLVGFNVCGRCGVHGECWDRELLDKYRRAGFSPIDIWTHLPLVRISFIDESHQLSWLDIEQLMTNAHQKMMTEHLQKRQGIQVH